MPKISRKRITEAWLSLCKSSPKKLWGLICVLSAIDTTSAIEAQKEYKVDLSKLKNTLKRLFSYKEDKMNPDEDKGKDYYYAILSIKWMDIAVDKFTRNKNGGCRVSILDAAIFYHANIDFQESDINANFLVNNFLKDINLAQSNAEQLFDCNDNLNEIIETENYDKSALFDHIRNSMEWETNCSRYLAISETGQSKISPDELTRGPIIQPLYASFEGMQYLLLSNKSLIHTYGILQSTDNTNFSNSLMSYQTIIYGAPGTGKSYYINHTTKGAEKIRVTFHPDSDYSTFVGAYKPSLDAEKKISYKFIPQAFASAYVKAWKKLLRNKIDPNEFIINDKQANEPEKYIKWLKCSIKTDGNPITNEEAQKRYVKTANDYLNMLTSDEAIPSIKKAVEDRIKVLDQQASKVSNNQRSELKKFITYISSISIPKHNDTELDSTFYLIIEEINRGNCAQIFGDIFQLLDRNESGFSEYPVDVDFDFAQYIESELEGTAQYKETICQLSGCPPEAFTFEKIALPSNLKLLATMNTSDQSLFPMDSAFKRRWDWEYMPIDTSKVSDVNIEISDSLYSWGCFLEKVNKNIYDVNTSEDKQLGPFFVKPNAQMNVISQDQFISKVMFYLWFEIYKDEDRESIFKITTSSEKDTDTRVEAFTFADLFRGSSVTILKAFMQRLGVKPIDQKNSIGR